MNKAYFFTETAFHHEGDLSYLKKLIKESAKINVHGIKFQVLTIPSDFIATTHSNFTELSNYCFNKHQWEEIFAYTLNLGLDIIMMPLNVESLQLCNKFNIRYLDIHSVSFFDLQLLEAIKETRMDLILGVGGRTLKEIQEKIEYFDDKIKVLMVGFQSFPSKLEKVKIGKIQLLKNYFKEIEIGYADHSAYDDKYSVLSNDYARILGATYFEKHITINEGDQRIDMASAVSSNKITNIISRISFIEKYVLPHDKESFVFDKSELEYRDRQLRCVVNNNVKRNHILTKKDVSLKMVNKQELYINNFNDVLGKKVNKPLLKDTPIKTDDLYE